MSYVLLSALLAYESDFMLAILAQPFGFGAGGFIVTYLPAKAVIWICRIKLAERTDKALAWSPFGVFFLCGLAKFSLR